ncbi:MULTISPECIES: GspH/FimT family pseudopilin [Shewanella]|jgi:type IV fimbrial biogenesis protein FimU|uniref:GspH/FimT family pseudopilin n=2 Tax=Shewanellaceae TaxID=267890 RepID=UPI000028110D|nr:MULTISPECIES: GspH/FimT family pseudopilin [Shewanella]KPN75480.1 methylation site containing protein [Shewanella sp. Sh95]MCL1069289.1 GspH/FimT family pseudopilin [Shewanella xiamenensis]MDH1627925.1 GspH/FimT family pseudopilin [Shewanella xiamenensis]MDV5245797.1 GspH/FimT family pseudopilin [Shewanella xiamenensis]PWH02181.1 prepilin-type N-terminal cleavage/methylation domain-containing protein [Shewanella xiamenensis]
MFTLSKGFTLVELMVTIAIAALLLSIGVPSFTAMYEATRSANEIQKINDLFAFARNQAVNYGSTVTVCPYAASPCGNDWSKGFSVYIEKNGSKKVLKVIDGFNSKDTISLTGPTDKTVNFTSDGLVSTETSIIYCPSGESDGSKSIKISTSGLIKEGSDNQSCL